MQNTKKIRKETVSGGIVVPVDPTGKPVGQSEIGYLQLAILMQFWRNAFIVLGSISKHRFCLVFRKMSHNPR